MLQMEQQHYKNSCRFIERKMIEKMSISKVNYNYFLKQIAQIGWETNEDPKECYKKLRIIESIIWEACENKTLKNYVVVCEKNERYLRDRLKELKRKDDKLIYLPKYEEQIEMELL